MADRVPVKVKSGHLHQFEAGDTINSTYLGTHNHAASDITSGQLALERGGTEADLGATGGTGQYLQQTSAGAAVTVGTISASHLPTGIDAAKIADGSISNTEFQYLNNVSSNIQTQLDSKASATITRTNNSGSTITKGAPVYATTTAGEIAEARANSVSTAKVLGLATAAISNTASGSVQRSGPMTLTTGEWDAIAGTSGGLTAGTEYFLSASAAGEITATAPTTTGQQVVSLGVASSTTVLDLKIEPYVGL